MKNIAVRTIQFALDSTNEAEVADAISEMLRPHLRDYEAPMTARAGVRDGRRPPPSLLLDWWYARPEADLAVFEVETAYGADWHLPPGMQTRYQVIGDALRDLVGLAGSEKLDELLAILSRVYDAATP